jgi:hypothetical protein
MRDLWIHENDLIVATHGRSFWILDDMSPLREASEGLGNSTHLFAPAPAYRIQRDTNTDTPLPPDEPMAPNPPDGAILDYYLPATANSAALEILDAQGHVVRRYSSADKAEATEDELRKQLIPLYWTRAPRQLSTSLGMHRWVWDLHYAAPLSMRHDYPISAIPHDTPRYPLGPNALPGSYTVRLTVDGKTSSAPLTIKMDPRIKTPAVGLQKKFDAETRLAKVITESAQALIQGASIRTQLEKLNTGEHAATKSAVEEFQKKLSALLGAPGGFFAPPSPEPTLSRVNGQAGTLYQQIWQADAEPTPSQMEPLASVERDSVGILKRWSDFKNAELPALNKLLRESQAPEIKIQTDVMPEESSVDEE